jgi:hypothetical protein
MKLEAVTVCVDYADFLAHTLPANKHLFDRLVVVTDTRDVATRRLCAYHHVECVQTDAFYLNDAAFNKGRGINAGLAALDLDGWLLHIDADIVLPPRARDIIERIDLDQSHIYGIDRLMCRSFDAWLGFLAAPEIQHEDEVFVQANAFDLGVRVAKTDADGYVPIGFFQLWHGSTGRLRYPDGHGAAARADMLFAQQWPRASRTLIPEIVGIHLESETAPGGANWRGRRTKTFGRATMSTPPRGYVG